MYNNLLPVGLIYLVKQYSLRTEDYRHPTKSHHLAAPWYKWITMLAAPAMMYLLGSTNEDVHIMEIVVYPG